MANAPVVSDAAITATAAFAAESGKVDAYGRALLALEPADQLHASTATQMLCSALSLIPVDLVAAFIFICSTLQGPARIRAHGGRVPA